MALSWKEIHELEVTGAYPQAIEALEARLSGETFDPEAVIRLGFNYWYCVVEKDVEDLKVPADEYAKRFMELFDEYKALLANHADFCWAFGLGMSLCWYYFPGATEEMGKELLERSKALDPFWRNAFCATKEDKAKKLSGRGILSWYYNVTT